MSVRDWGDIEKAKILIIGHDPRLRGSDTIAEYCFFADYYFKHNLTTRSDKRKYGLAKSTFEQIFYLTGDKYCTDDILLTNLCNEELPHAPKGKTVLIPYEKAKDGLVHILNILEKGKIEYVFSTSLQVNYWMQKLCFYSSNKEFLEAAEPKQKGVESSQPYYEAKRPRAFQLICGDINELEDKKYKVIPILHPKNYPIKGRFTCYQANYDKIKNYFTQI